MTGNKYYEIFSWYDTNLIHFQKWSANFERVFAIVLAIFILAYAVIYCTVYDHTYYHALLTPSEVRAEHPYMTDDDVHGQFIVNAERVDNDDTDAD